MVVNPLDLQSHTKNHVQSQDDWLTSLLWLTVTMGNRCNEMSMSVCAYISARLHSESISMEPNKKHLTILFRHNAQNNMLARTWQHCTSAMLIPVGHHSTFFLHPNTAAHQKRRIKKTNGTIKTHHSLLPNTNWAWKKTWCNARKRLCGNECHSERGKVFRKWKEKNAWGIRCAVQKRSCFHLSSDSLPALIEPKQQSCLWKCSILQISKDN